MSSRMVDPVVVYPETDSKNEFTCSTSFINKKIISCISLRRYLKNGNTSVAFYGKNKIINDYIKKITLKLEPFGVTNFQLRLVDKCPVIFEIFTIL